MGRKTKEQSKELDPLSELCVHVEMLLILCVVGGEVGNNSLKTLAYDEGNGGACGS